MEPNKNSNLHGRVSSRSKDSRGDIKSLADQKQRDAALNLVRGQINAIYQGDDQQIHEFATDKPVRGQYVSGSMAPANSSAQNFHSVDLNSPYEKSHTKSNLSSDAQKQWQQYHSAWQNYYQKYYENYYVAEVSKNIKNRKRNRDLGRTGVFVAQPGIRGSGFNGSPEKKTKLDELRESIVQKAREETKKVRKSRHFLPIVSALIVVAVFAFLQYNQVLIANVKAYMSPGLVDAQNIIIDPTQKVPVDPNSTKMIIPKINVDAPVVYGVGPTEQEQLNAMRDGIAHVKYPNGASAMPGQIGNSVFSAHSSSDWTDSGNYKFIFVQLDRLTNNDVIYLDYQGTRYTYKVTETRVVMPTEIDALNYDPQQRNNKPIITLITCTPLGTAQKRLLVYAEQVSPSPDGAQPAEQIKPNQAPAMPGNTPTVFERMFGR